MSSEKVTLKALRNAQIKKEFEVLTKKKKIQTRYAVEQLAGKYFLTKDTIECIVWEMGYYKPKSTPQAGEQLTMF